MVCRHTYYFLPSFLTWGCVYRRWRCASLHSVQWAERVGGRLGMGCSGCMYTCGQYKNFYKHGKNKSVTPSFDFVLWRPQILDWCPSAFTKCTKQETTTLNQTGKPTSPHSNRGYRDLCRQIQKWLASCSLLIKDGSPDCMCDWPVAIYAIGCLLYVLCIASVRNRRVDKLDYQREMW